MSFLAINADSNDSQVAIAQSLQYEELRYDYEEVLSLCSSNLQDAWKRLNSLLDGELFAEGPTFRYQPSIRELQRSCLALALDISKKIDPDSLVSLTLESLEWFPEEPLFWRQLTESQSSSFLSSIIKNLAMKKYLSYNPYDKDMRKRQLQIESSLGSYNKGVMIEEERLGPSSIHFYISFLLKVDLVPMTIPITDFVIHQSEPFSKVLDRFNDLIEELLDQSPKRSRTGNSSGSLLKLSLSSLIKISLLNDIDKNEASQAIEEPSLLLSQTGSIKDFNDYSQVSTRSQGRRHKQNHFNAIAQTVEKPDMKDLMLQLTNILSKSVTKEEEIILNRIIKARDDSSQDLDCYSYRIGLGDDPINFDFWENENNNPINLTEAISLLSEFIANFSESNFLTDDSFRSTNRFLRILYDHIDILIPHLSENVLLWVAEFAVENDLEVTFISSLSVKILVPYCNISNLARFFWVSYKSNKDMTWIARLEKLLLIKPSGSNTLDVNLRASLDPKQRVILNSRSVEKRKEIISSLKEFSVLVDNLSVENWPEFMSKIGGDLPSFLLSCFENPSVVSFCLKVLSMDVLSDFDSTIVGMVLLLLNDDMDNFERVSPKSLSKAWQILSKNFKLFCQVVEKFRGPILTLSIVDGLLNVGQNDPRLIEDMLRTFVVPDKVYLRDTLFMKNLLSLLPISVSSIRFPFIRLILGITSPLKLKEMTALSEVSINDVLSESQRKELANLVAVEDINYLLSNIDFDEMDTSSSYNCLEEIIRFMLNSFYPEDSILIKRRYLLMMQLSSNEFENQLNVPSHGNLSELDLLLLNCLSLKLQYQPSLSTIKKKNREILSSLREEMVLLILLSSNESNFNYFWKLGILFETELRSLLIKDPVTLTAESSLIQKLIRGTFNSWKIALFIESNCVDSIWKFANFLRSIVHGILGFFCKNVSKQYFGKLLNRILKDLCDSNSRDWRILWLKSLFMNWIGKPRVLVIGLRIASLDEYLTNTRHSNQDQLYFMTHKIIRGLLKIVDMEVAPKLYNSLNDVLVKFELPVSNGSTLKENLLDMTEKLGKFDKKKLQHAHTRTVIRFSDGHTLNLVKQKWSRLFPVLLKPKSNQFINIWQTDNDYPGDYLYFSENCALDVCKDIVSCDGNIVEKAKLIATMIGRIAGAKNVFIRRRKLLTSCSALLYKLVNEGGQGDENSLADFETFEKVRESLEEILNDCLELVTKEGGQLPF